MAAPTLVYGATTLVLPYPSSSTSRTYGEVRISKRTAAGHLRTSVLSRTYSYSLKFDYTSVAVYDAVVALWEQAIAGGGYPTFNFTEAFPSASGIAVALTIGPLAPTDKNLMTLGFQLGLDEATPR